MLVKGLRRAAICPRHLHTSAELSLCVCDCMESDECIWLYPYMCPRAWMSFALAWVYWNTRGFPMGLSLSLDCQVWGSQIRWEAVAWLGAIMLELFTN